MLDRQKLLAWGVGALAVLWLVDQLYFSPWYAEMKKLGSDLDNARQRIAVAKATVANRKAVMDEWKVLDERLKRPRASDVPSEFTSGLQAMSGLVGLQNFSSKMGREQKIGERGEFTEHAVETSFQANWKSFVGLLKELKGWKDFIKVQRLSITSKYEKENRLDVEMRVSTIELSQTRAGVKQ